MLKTADGKPLTDAATKKKLNTASLITICLGQSKYPSVADQWNAYEITKKIKEGKDVELEDSDYQLVKNGGIVRTISERVYLCSIPRTLQRMKYVILTGIALFLVAMMIMYFDTL